MHDKNFFKITSLILAGALWGLSPLSHGAQTNDNGKSLQEVQQELTEAGQAIQSYSAAQRDKAVEQVKAALTTLDGQIEALQVRLDQQWDQLSDSARAKARSSLATLQQQRTEVAEWLA